MNRRPLTAPLTAALLAVILWIVPSPAQPPAAGEIRVHVIDVGQADAILVQSAANAVLIDGGDYKTRDKLIKYLRSAQITALDYVVATHPHADHIGGLAPVIRAFPVKNVLMPDAIHTSKAFEHLLTAIEDKNVNAAVPNVGDTIRAGIITLIVLSPGSKFKDLNDMSIVLHMTHDNTSFLFTGDAESHAESAILQTGRNVRADVLKVGHHGSRSSTSARFLDAVSPKIAVISCGSDNKYGHPHPEIVNRLNQPKRNITVLRTDEAGTVVLTTDGTSIQTRKEKD